MTTEKDSSFEIELTSEIVAAYVGNNPVAADQLPQLISSVFDSVAGLAGEQAEPEPEKKEPAVSVRKSMQHDHLVCLEDGMKFKSLKRHLKAQHGLTPEQYRERWGLKPDYPMVAPAYAEVRSAMAKKIGLGNKSSRSKK